MKAKKPAPIDFSNIPVVNICPKCGSEMWEGGVPDHPDCTWFCIWCDYEEKVNPNEK